MSTKYGLTLTNDQARCINSLSMEYALSSKDITSFFNTLRQRIIDRIPDKRDKHDIGTYLKKEGNTGTILYNLYKHPDEYKALLSLIRRKPEPADILQDFCVTLQPHQRAVVNHLATHRGLILWHGTGTGKTISAIASTQCILRTPEHANKRVLVVTPIENFVSELHKVGITQDPRYTTTGVKNFYLHADRFNCNNTILVIDEAHALRTKITPKSGKQVQSLIDCAKRAYKVILLTATPIVNELYDVENMIAMAEGREPTKATQFYRMLGTSADASKKLEPNVLMNLLQSNRNYFKCLFSVYEKQGQDPHFPTRVDDNIIVTMTPEELTKLRILERQEVKGSSALMVLQGLRRATNILNEGENSKIQKTIELVIDNYTNSKKTVIFTNWIGAGVTILYNMLKEYVTVGYITGKIAKAARPAIVNKYNAGELDVLLISGAGGVGLDLKETYMIILLDPPWNSSVEDQAIGRAIRYNSHINLPPEDRVVQVVTLIYKKPDELVMRGEEPTADELLYELIERKRILIDTFRTFIESVSIEALDC